MIDPGRPCVLLPVVTIFSLRDFQGPWVDLSEILPHVWKHVQFTKIWESVLKKIWGAKNVLNFTRFQTPSHFEREYLRNR